jgi:hypothetical protein
MPNPKAKINWSTFVATTVAVVALGLNVLQFMMSRSDRAAKLKAEAKELYHMDPFFALANDNALGQIYGLDSRSSNHQDVSQFQRVIGSELDNKISKYVSIQLNKKSGSFRRDPVASFLVMHNDGERQLTGVKAVAVDSSFRKILVEGAQIRPGEYLFVALDMTDVRSVEPSLPSEVEITYQNQQGDMEILRPMPHKTTWIGEDFVRAMPGED